MKETLKAFVLLERAKQIVNVEQAARILGIHDVASRNSVDRLWEIAHEPEAKPVGAPVVVGSEPVLEIATENPPGGQAPGVRPAIRMTRKAGK